MREMDHKHRSILLPLAIMPFCKVLCGRPHFLSTTLAATATRDVAWALCRFDYPYRPPVRTPATAFSKVAAACRKHLPAGKRFSKRFNRSHTWKLAPQTLGVPQSLRASDAVGRDLVFDVNCFGAKHRARVGTARRQCVVKHELIRR